MSRGSLNVIYGQTTRWVLIAVLTIGLMVALWQVHNTLLLVFTSIVLVVLFTMPTRFLVRLGFPRTPAVLVSLVGFVVILVALMLLALPSLLQQFTTLTTTIPEGVNQIVQQWEDIQNDTTGTLKDQYPFIASLQLFLKDTFQLDSLDALFAELTRQLGGAIGQLSGSVIPVVSGVADILLGLVIVIIVTLYLLADPYGYEQGVIKQFPVTYRHRVRHIIDRIDFTLRIWLQGQLLLMLIVGIVSGIGMALLGIKQAAAVGVLAGVFSFVPNFGPIAALIPSLAVGLVQTPDKVLWIVLIIYGTSALQSQIIAPLIFQESLKIPPVLVLVGQVFAAIFFGVLGLMMAVPLTAITIILVQEVYVKDILGDYEDYS
ncbi:MAG: AI-2E family transporter, partial [Anaerolineae bacterium]|nr:AI-2E family transporter [Anaerolineae bacterium]